MKTNCDKNHECTLGNPANCDYYICRNGVSVSHVVYCTYFGIKNVPAAGIHPVGDCVERKAWPENNPTPYLMDVLNEYNPNKIVEVTIQKGTDVVYSGNNG